MIRKWPVCQWWPGVTFWSLALLDAGTALSKRTTYASIHWVVALAQKTWFNGTEAVVFVIVLYNDGREVPNYIRVEGGEFGLCAFLLVLFSFQCIGLCWILVVCLCFDHLNIWPDSQGYLGAGIRFQLEFSPTNLTYRTRHPGLHSALHTKNGEVSVGTLWAVRSLFLAWLPRAREQLGWLISVYGHVYSRIYTYVYSIFYSYV